MCKQKSNRFFRNSENHTQGQIIFVYKTNQFFFEFYSIANFNLLFPMIANSWHGVKTPTKPTFDLCLYLPLYHPSANLLSKLWHWLFKYPYWRTTTPPVYNSRNVILVTCIAFVEMKYESTFVFILFVLCRNLGSTI